MPSNRKVILLLDTTNPHQRKVAQGVATYAHEHGRWNLLVVQEPLDNLPYLEYDPLESSRDFAKAQADGIIAYCPSQRAACAIRRLNAAAVGIELEFGLSDPGWEIPYFATDNQAIGRLGAKELIDRGFERVAFCGVPPSLATGWSAQRQTAFEKFAAEAGVPCSTFPLDGSSKRKSGNIYKQLSAWLKSLEKPVGLMACYDVRARHVLSICQELGILTPEDVAVIGVDNDELMCELSNPPLSSIEQGSRAIGYRAAELLDRMMAGGRPKQLKHLVQPEGVVTRRSSDALGIDDPDVAAALAYIRRRACEGIQMRDVVQSVAISRSALTVRFKTVTGRTIHAEIQRVQIDRARQLIVTTDLPLHEVARQSGFRYVQHLIAIFHRHMGVNPGEYRMQSQNAY